MNAPVKGLKELMARVLEDPSRESFRDLLRDHMGEAPFLDFKALWPDMEKLARHILAIANSGGGAIIVGVVECADKTLDPVGLETLTDKADISKKVKPFLPDALSPLWAVYDFAYDASDYAALTGKKFQMVVVGTDAKLLPFVAERALGDLRVCAIYVRRGTESVEASHTELQRLINERLATGHSTAAAMKLDDHLDQLKVLEDRIPRTIMRGGMGAMANVGAMIESWEPILGRSEPNPDFPKEDFEGLHPADVHGQEGAHRSGAWRCILG